MKHLLLSTLLIASAAGAQRSVPVTFTPVTIDGVTTPNGLVKVDGKSFVSLDALRARGLTLLTSSSLGLYAFPNAQKQTVKLRGCLNEQLFNGVDRMKVTDVSWDAANEVWRFSYVLQTPLYINVEQHFALEKAIVMRRSGSLFQPSKDPIQAIEISGSAQPSVNNQGTITLKDPNEDGSDPPVKLVLPGGAREDTGKGVLTFDLTCKK